MMTLNLDESAVQPRPAIDSSRRVFMSDAIRGYRSTDTGAWAISALDRRPLRSRPAVRPVEGPATEAPPHGTARRRGQHAPGHGGLRSGS